jgi:hypothetical protein
MQALEQPLKLVRHLPGELGSAVELGRGGLKDGDLPLTVGIDGGQGLQGIGIWVESTLPRRHHAHNGAQDRHLWSQQAHTFNFADIGSRDVVSEDGANIGRYLPAPLHLAAIEADNVGIFGEEGGEVSGSAPVPRIEQLFVQAADHFHVGPASSGRLC